MPRRSRRPQRRSRLSSESGNHELHSTCARAASFAPFFFAVRLLSSSGRLVSASTRVCRTPVMRSSTPKASHSCAAAVNCPCSSCSSAARVAPTSSNVCVETIGRSR